MRMRLNIEAISRRVAFLTNVSCDALPCNLRLLDVGELRTGGYII